MESGSDSSETSLLGRVRQVFTKSQWVPGTENKEKIQPLAQETHTQTTARLPWLPWFLVESRRGRSCGQTLRLHLGIITS